MSGGARIGPMMRENGLFRTAGVVVRALHGRSDGGER